MVSYRFLLTAALLAAIVVSHMNDSMAYSAGNLLISTNDVLYEYTRGGVRVRSLTIPYPSSRPATESARDLIHRGNEIHVYNGTFDPYVSTLDTRSSRWQHSTRSGLSTVNNGTYGGIAVSSHGIFVTDMRTFGDSGADEAQGIVRFAPTGTRTRFGENIEPIDLAMGLDGMLYALHPGGSPEGTRLSVYDPASLSFQRTINLNSSNRAVAVNAVGEIFLADWSGNLRKLMPNGTQSDTLNICSCNLYDIDLSPRGEIVVGDRFGGVYLTDESFSNPSSFTVGTNGIFVAFVSVPEPSSIFLLALSCAFWLSRRTIGSTFQGLNARLASV